MKTREQAIEVLAEYLSNSVRVVGKSIALQAGGAKAVAEAKAFFDLRNAFCVDGYSNKDEAQRVIELVLKEKTNA